MTSSPISERYLKTDSILRDISYKEFLRNYMIINIFFSSMNEEVIEESEAYSWLALMSDIGGAFGLILGSTFLTLIEIFDFLFVSIIEILTLKIKKNSNK